MSKLTKIIFFVFLNLILTFFNTVVAAEKIKIGLLVPMTGNNKDLGQSIIKAVSLAIKDIDSNLIEVIPKDTASMPNKTLKSAFELKLMEGWSPEKLAFQSKKEELSIVEILELGLENKTSQGCSQRYLKDIKRVIKLWIEFEETYHYKGLLITLSLKTKVLLRGSSKTKLFPFSAVFSFNANDSLTSLSVLAFGFFK